MNEIKNKIIQKIKMEQEISPFLFISENLELINDKIEKLAYDILGESNIPKTNFFIIKDNGETIKLNEIKIFFKKFYSRNPYGLQIFFIENISRMTLESINSCLKIFEEPGKQNLIFMSNSSTSGILETILSRVQVIDIKLNLCKQNNSFYTNLINEYLENKNQNLIKYFFDSKLEKQDYLVFLETLLNYFISNLINTELIEELFSDIQATKKNNVLVKNLVYKWLLKI